MTVFDQKEEEQKENIVSAIGHSFWPLPVDIGAKKIQLLKTLMHLDCRHNKC